MQIHTTHNHVGNLRYSYSTFHWTVGNTKGVSIETGNAYPSGASGFITGLLVWSMLLIFIDFNIVSFALFVFVLCHVPSVFRVSGLFILDRPFGFL